MLSAQLIVRHSLCGAAAASLLLVIGACGGDGSSAEPTISSPEPTTSSTQSRREPAPPAPRTVAVKLRRGPALPAARTVGSIPGEVYAFAQDGRHAAVGRTHGACHKAIVLFDFTTGGTSDVMKRDDCDTGISEIASAVAVGGERVLWDMSSGSNTELYDRFLIATRRGTEPVLGAANSYEDLSDPGPPMFLAGDGGTLALYAYSYGGEGGASFDAVFLVANRKARQLADGAVDALAVVDGRVATVERGGGRLEVRRVPDGKLVGAATLRDRGVAVAVSEEVAVVLTKGGDGDRLELFDAADADTVRSIRLPRGSKGMLSISGPVVTLLTARGYVLVDLDALTIAPIPASRNAIGLSVEGDRIAWLESTDRGHSIRVIELG